VAALRRKEARPWQTKTGAGARRGHQQVLQRAQGRERQGPEGRQGEALAKIEADLAKADAENQRRIADAEKKAAAADRARRGAREADGPHQAGRAGARRRPRRSCRPGRKLQNRWFRTGKLDEAKALELKVLQKGDDTAGGYLASPEFSSDIIKDVVLYSPMRGLVRVRPAARARTRLRKRTACRPRPGWPSSRRGPSRRTRRTGPTRSSPTR
jgi:HK97 family phage major capsid protein